ncbi:MAG: hypothetical protein PHS37_08825 [Candidatus Omnitrophica bacterium]|nr:hypothetical protein [Candidatus Omnitrophota bacterium]
MKRSNRRTVLIVATVYTCILSGFSFAAQTTTPQSADAKSGESKRGWYWFLKTGSAQSSSSQSSGSTMDSAFKPANYSKDGMAPQTSTPQTTPTTIFSNDNNNNSQQTQSNQPHIFGQQ